MHAERASQARPFRHTVLRGLATLLPPLLTVVFLVWAWGTLRWYLLDPITVVTRDVVSLYLLNREARYDLSGTSPSVNGTVYQRMEGSTYVPHEVYELVRTQGSGPVPASSRELYRQYVQIQYLRPHLVIPVFILVLTLLMYLLGKFIAAGVGKIFWDFAENMIKRLPLVRVVYSSVKQVTDMMFNEQEIQFLGVVAVQYPCKGIWAMGFITGEGLQTIRNRVGEPVLCVLIPTSPAPMTGFTTIVPKSEALELNMTLDQALQFIVSCGVVIPPHQLTSLAAGSAAALPGRALAPKSRS